MIKCLCLFIIFYAIQTFNGFGQAGGDETYFWNTAGLTYSLSDKIEFTLSNKDHFNVKTGRFDYFHFDLAGYRKLSKHFSLGIGIRLNETYKSDLWNRGGVYMFYGVYSGISGNLNFKFANRIAIRTSAISETQYTFDNITTVDFFAQSSKPWPKPYLMDEIFTNLGYQKIQTIRLYGGFHVLRLKRMGVDLFYCHQKARPLWVWKDFNIVGVNTKFRI